MSDATPKNYPASSSEIAKLLGLDKTESHAPAHAAEAHTATGPAPAHLPVASDHGPKDEAHGHSEPAVHDSHDHGTTVVEPQANVGAALTKVAKTAAPFAVLFVVAVFIYYFFLSSFDLTGWLRSRDAEVQTPKDTAIEKLYDESKSDYDAWIAGFYYDVSDTSLLDPKADNSGNGLSNFHKYLLNLNPKSYDTLGLGMSDSEALAAGINPLSGNKLTNRQKEIVDNYFDMEVIINKLTVARLHQQGTVAGAQTSATTSYPFPTATSTSETTGSTGGNYLQQNLNSVDIDTSIAGELEVPKLGIKVPIIWTEDPKNFDRDLQSGVVHYPGTAMPGQIGTTYISGHSSNVAWAKGSYNRIFSKLDQLPDGASFKITVVQKNGKDAIFHYVVTRRQEYKPTDQAQFLNSGTSTVALSTCWPVGSTARRMVVFGELTQTEK